MRKILQRAAALTLVYATILHFLWGIILITAARTTTLRTTPFAYILDLFGPDTGGLLMLGSAAAAWTGLRFPGWRGLGLGTVQNALLWLAATSGLVASWVGHYADGVPRSHAFIFADQLPIMLLAPFHFWALIAYHAPWAKAKH